MNDPARFRLTIILIVALVIGIAFIGHSIHAVWHDSLTQPNMSNVGVNTHG